VKEPADRFELAPAPDEAGERGRQVIGVDAERGRSRAGQASLRLTGRNPGDGSCWTLGPRPESPHTGPLHVIFLHPRSVARTSREWRPQLGRSIEAGPARCAG